MKIYVMDNKNYSKFQMNISANISRANATYLTADIAIIDDLFWNLEDCSSVGVKREIYELDMLAQDEMIEKILRLEQCDLVVINLYGVEEQKLNELAAKMYLYVYELRDKVKEIIFILQKDKISDFAMMIEKNMYINNLKWNCKNFRDLYKNQRKESFRYKYIYDYKYMHKLFIGFGKVKHFFRHSK